VCSVHHKDVMTNTQEPGVSQVFLIKKSALQIVQ
jgi:hypothetical protein